MPDLTDGMLGTIGLEIETELLLEEYGVNGWRNIHDASIEIPITYLRNRHFVIVRTPQNVMITNMLHQGEYIAMGREYVSPIYFNKEETLGGIQNILGRIQQFGERTQNKRAGFHVHIGWAYDLKTLKRTTLMIAWLESLLFHLGGMGYEFRGMDNNSAYCRPITMYGPPIVDSNIGKVQMTNIEALLSSPTIKSFWNRFGGIDLYNIPKRYTPQRYMGVNLFSIFLHKTLEFRMFNTTLNKEYIMAIVELCKELTRFTLSNERFPDEENSVYMVNNKVVNHNLLSRLCSYIELDSETEQTLRDILEWTPVPTLPHVYVFTHLEDKIVVFDEHDLAKVTPLYPRVEEYIRSGIMDIHILERELEDAREKLERVGNRDQRVRAGQRLRLRFEEVINGEQEHPEEEDQDEDDEERRPDADGPDGPDGRDFDGRQDEERDHNVVF